MTSPGLRTGVDVGDQPEPAAVRGPEVRLQWSPSTHWDLMGQWGHQGWKRLVFPGLFLVVLSQTVSGVADHSHGLMAATGYASVAAFCAFYLVALTRVVDPGSGFTAAYLALYALFGIGLWTAHQDALPMAIFLGVLAIARFGKRFLWIAAVLVGLDFALPALFGWPQQGQAFTLVIVLAANYAFFHLLWTNVELAQARAEIARLAAEGERQRIARDLHDLLGHSLTTITVKAALARRLAESGDTERSRAEVAQLEEISRVALADVRAAVTGYRQVSLAGELVTGRELAQTLGVQVSLPASTDVVPAEHQELFGWVVREGITNVVRHAQATSCTVAVGPDWIEMVDDGRGAPAGGGGPARPAPAGNGLLGLRERVERAGGRLTAGPDRAGGWRLRADMASHRGRTPHAPAGAAARTGAGANAGTGGVIAGAASAEGTGA